MRFLDKIRSRVFSLLGLLFLVLMLPVLTIEIGKEAQIFSKAAADDDNSVQSFQSEQPKPDGIIIKYKNNVQNQDQKIKVVRQKGIEADVKDLRFDNLSAVKVPEDKVDRYIEELKNDPEVEYVEADEYLPYAEVPNDKYFSKQWFLTKIKAPQAWDISKGSPSVNVAIVDSGVAVNHPDLSSKITKRMNSQNDEPGHGTHVAGIAAAATNNGIGVAGTGRDVRLMVADVGNKKGVNMSAAISAIRWAADNGATTLNMSWGGPSNSSSLNNAIQYAWGKGVVLVAAAGNNGNTQKSPPASLANVFSVAAVNSSDKRAGFSTYGSWVDIAAPGVNIVSTVPNGYASYDGTSMASPVVTGAAALIKSAFPNYTNQQIVDRLCSTADKIGGEGTKWKCGRINLYKAVLGGGAPTQPPTGGPVPTATGQPVPTPTVGPISDTNYQIKLNFQGINRKSAPQKIYYRVQNQSTILTSGNVYAGSDDNGVYTLQIPKTSVSSGTYSILIKGESHLGKLYTNVTLSHQQIS